MAQNKTKKELKSAPTSPTVLPPNEPLVTDSTKDNSEQPAHENAITSATPEDNSARPLSDCSLDELMEIRIKTHKELCNMDYTSEDFELKFAFFEQVDDLIKNIYLGLKPVENHQAPSEENDENERIKQKAKKQLEALTEARQTEAEANEVEVVSETRQR